MKPCARSKCSNPNLRPISKFCSSLCQQLEWAKNNYDKFKKNQSAYYSRTLAAQRLRGRAGIIKLKAELLGQYGHSCMCCGENRVEFLTLDHVNRDGGQARKKHGVTGSSYWRMLKRNGWPKAGYRILCIACNFVTRYGRPCPHTLEPLYGMEGC
jgi:hypothetical protein